MTLHIKNIYIFGEISVAYLPQSYRSWWQYGYVVDSYTLVSVKNIDKKKLHLYMQPITTAEQDNLLARLEIAHQPLSVKYIDKAVMLQTILTAMQV